MNTLLKLHSTVKKIDGDYLSTSEGGDVVGELLTSGKYVATTDAVSNVSDSIAQHKDNTDNPHSTNLSHLGVSATAAQINYLSGVTSDVQTQLNGKAASSHNHSAGEITSSTLTLARGGTGVSLSSNPSMLVNLASTSAASVFAASPRPGVTGTLPIANGGTGATSASAARTNLGLGTAATCSYTSSVTSSSSSLVTSGAVYTALSSKANASALNNYLLLAGGTVGTLAISAGASESNDLIFNRPTSYSYDCRIDIINNNLRVYGYNSSGTYYQSITMGLGGASTSILQYSGIINDACGGLSATLLAYTGARFSTSWTVDASGHLIPYPNGGGKYYVGTSSYPVNTVNYSGSLTKVSDRKAKTDITYAIDKASDLVMSLSPVTYKLKEGTGRIHMGLIAQDVHTALQDIEMEDLSFCQAAVVDGSVDEDGNIIEKYYDETVSDENLRWSLSYEELIAPLIAVVQKQQKEIDELKQLISS